MNLIYFGLAPPPLPLHLKPSQVNAHTAFSPAERQRLSPLSLHTTEGSRRQTH